MKEYKIKENRISDYAKKVNNRVFIVLAICMLSFPLLMYPMTMQEGAPDEMIWIIIGSMLLTYPIIGLIYLNNKKLSRLVAENYKVTIDESSIVKSIDLDSEPRMNFFHKYAFKRAKKISDGTYCKINFVDLKSIGNKQGDLIIKSTKSNSINGRNIVVIPKELNGFEEIENIITELLK
jgi:hypothetical protein